VQENPRIFGDPRIRLRRRRYRSDKLLCQHGGRIQRLVGVESRELRTRNVKIIFLVVWGRSDKSKSGPAGPRRADVRSALG
jgi:hypothetical protein